MSLQYSRHTINNCTTYPNTDGSSVLTYEHQRQLTEMVCRALAKM